MIDWGFQSVKESAFDLALPLARAFGSLWDFEIVSSWASKSGSHFASCSSSELESVIQIVTEIASSTDSTTPSMIHSAFDWTIIPDSSFVSGCCFAYAFELKSAIAKVTSTHYLLASASNWVSETCCYSVNNSTI